MGHWVCEDSAVCRAVWRRQSILESHWSHPYVIHRYEVEQERTSSPSLTVLCCKYILSSFSLLQEFGMYSHNCMPVLNAMCCVNFGAYILGLFILFSATASFHCSQPALLSQGKYTTLGSQCRAAPSREHTVPVCVVPSNSGVHFPKLSLSNYRCENCS